MREEGPARGRALFADHFHEVGDLADHAAHFRRVDKFLGPAKFVETKALQRLALVGLAADRTADLADGEFFLSHRVSPSQFVESAMPASDAPSARRPTTSWTLRPRLEATVRGLACSLSASNVARTMLYGFEEPIDLPTTSWTPSTSMTARIGPPAITPVPGGAARRTTLPAP